MTNLLAEFDYVNRTKGWRTGSDGIVETRFETAGELYKFCLREYGRCVSSCYVDQPDGKAKRIGWVFEKRMKYDDCNEYFVCETWVTIHEALPECHTIYHYAELAR